MKKILLTLLQYVIFLGLGVVIIVYMFNELTAQDKAEMFSSIKSVRIPLLFLILVVGFFSHYFRALRWKLLLEPLRIFPSTINITFAVLIGYITNLVLPRAGEVAKCTVLARYEKVPADKMVGTILAERAFDVLCLGIIIALAFILQGHVLGGFINERLANASSKTKEVLIGVLGLIVLIIIAVVIYRKNKGNKVGGFIKNMGHGVRSILHMKKRWEFIGYTFLIWFMYMLQIYIGFKCLPATDHLGMLVAFVVLVFGSFGMIATQGGIGAYPAAVAGILLAYNIDHNIGLAFGWVAWAVQTGIIIILGILSFILLPIYNRNNYAKSPLDTRQDTKPGSAGM
ncbi:MAG: lysylphosphatidylglycerol synthase transmembrane domain-containing protein [Flavipsychrobacter sp.]|nr:lysylphosphatidylglycerol synthase transmembrane domain-containing protein [Flavipsychrobacter sp.]